MGTRVRTLHENTVLELKILKSNALGSAGVSEKLNLLTGAEAEALTLADFDQPRGAGGECLNVDTFRHEEHLVEGDRREV